MLAVEADLPCVGLQRSRECLDQCRLPCTVVADDRRDLDRQQVEVGARERRDVFVITNMRVFRVHGVLSTTLATMPLTRILDITVQKPLLGRVLGYGHFVFESAAQDQGLHDIRFVARPDQRDLAIQRVVQRAGLRGPVDVN